MILLINVDEKNQIMQTNVWLTLKWNDCHFGWNPQDYHGIESIRVPSERLWSPDVVLFNNADGNYVGSFVFLYLYIECGFRKSRIDPMQ